MLFNEITVEEFAEIRAREAYEDGEKYGFTKGEQSGFTKGEKSGFTKGEKSGFTKGEKSGFTKGETAGLAKGRSEGAAQEKREIAKNFKKAGIPMDLIAENTGLSVAEVEQLQAVHKTNEIWRIVCEAGRLRRVAVFFSIESTFSTYFDLSLQNTKNT